MSMVGSAWSSKDPQEGYVLYVVSPAESDGWWRCLVLMDTLDLEEEGSFLNVSQGLLERDFDRVG